MIAVQSSISWTIRQTLTSAKYCNTDYLQWSGHVKVCASLCTTLKPDFVSFNLLRKSKTSLIPIIINPFFFFLYFAFPDEYQHIFQAAGKLLPPLGLNFLKFSLSLRYYSPRVELFNKVSESLIQFTINFCITLFHFDRKWLLCF